MNRSKKCKYVLIIFSLVITVSLVLPSNSYGFKNGDFVYSVEEYISDYSFNGGLHHYATHDWIAERALEILYEEGLGLLPPNARIFIERLYSLTDPLRLRFHYLLGTEAPDLKMSYSAPGDIILFDCDGEVFSLSGEEHEVTPKHINNSKYRYIKLLFHVE